MQLPSKKEWKINTVVHGMCSLEKLGLDLKPDTVLLQKKVRIFFWLIKNVLSLFSKVDKDVSNKNYEIKIDQRYLYSAPNNWTLCFVFNYCHYGCGISKKVGPKETICLARNQHTYSKETIVFCEYNEWQFNKNSKIVVQISNFFYQKLSLRLIFLNEKSPIKFRWFWKLKISFEYLNFWPKILFWHSTTERTLVNLSLWFNVLSSSPTQLILYLTQCSTFSELVNASRQTPCWSVLHFWKIKLGKSSSTNWIFSLFGIDFLLPV